MTCTEKAAPQSHRKADRSAADDQHSVTRLQAGAFDRVQPDCERLDQRPFLEAHGIGQRERFLGTDPREFGIGAGKSRTRPGQGRRAAMRASCATGNAAAAAELRHGADPVADLPVAARRPADLHHLAGEFMAEH